MRCKACDSELTDYEATRKCEATGEYPDLCNKCFWYISEEILVDPAHIDGDPNESEV